MNIESGITLSGVTKSYGLKSNEVTIFSNLDMTIMRGEFVAIMGPSGSGKSTLLHLMGGLDRADAGEIRCMEARIDNMSDHTLTRWRGRHVGFIFQFYNLMAALTAEQNVELPLLLTSLGAKERRERVAVALDIVGLADRKGHRPHQLSGGQKQRVAIARAIISDPDVLLCDEPTGDLDRKSADNILEVLRMLNEERGKTIIMVTHDPEAANFASRTITLNKGSFTSGAH